MKKGIKIAKKVAIVAGKIGIKIGKKATKEGAKATIFIVKSSYKGAKKTYQEYKKLGKNTKRRLHQGLLVAGSVLTVAGTAYTCLQSAPEEQKEKIEVNADTLNSKLTQVYDIKDEESFKQLYEDALPLLQASMVPLLRQI